MPTPLVLALALTLSAPVPPEEKPKPRPKLVGTLYQDTWVQAVHWTPDGKHLVLVSESKVLVYPRDALTPTEKTYPGEKVKPLTWFDRPDLAAVRVGGQLVPTLQIGLTAAGGVWAVVPAGQKLNAENRLMVWEAKTLQAGGDNPKPDRTVELEADNPLNVVLAADGKHLLATLGEPRIRADNLTGRQTWTDAPRFARLSAKTGDLKHATRIADQSEHPCVGCGFDPATGRLFLALNADDGVKVECRPTDGGKAVWERAVTGKLAGERPAEFTFSPNGEWVAVAHPVNITVGAPARNPRERPREECVYDLALLDANTGKPGPVLDKPDAQTAHVYGFSADGRLLFGRVQSLDGRVVRMVVWDTKSGAEAKAWVRQQAVLAAAFAPAGHELLIVEQDGGRVLLGVWDLAPLVK